MLRILKVSVDVALVRGSTRQGLILIVMCVCCQERSLILRFLDLGSSENEEGIDSNYL